MTAVVSTEFRISGLSKSMASAVGRKARRQGMTVDQYLKELIADDVELDRIARTRSFAELAVPFEKALFRLSEQDLDALARPRLRNAAGKTGR